MPVSIVENESDWNQRIQGQGKYPSINCFPFLFPLLSPRGICFSLEGIRDCDISPLPAGSQHHYLSFCVWVQGDLLCHTGKWSGPEGGFTFVM